eukprot:6463719-Amphidinium_carterae.1
MRCDGRWHSHNCDDSGYIVMVSNHPWDSVCGVCDYHDHAQYDYLVCRVFDDNVCNFGECDFCVCDSGKCDFSVCDFGMCDIAACDFGVCDLGTDECDLLSCFRTRASVCDHVLCWTGFGKEADMHVCDFDKCDVSVCDF